MWFFRPKTTEELKNSAFLVFTEFGPQLRIPRFERLSLKFNRVHADVVAEWIVEFEQVEASMWAFAEKGGPKSYSLKTFSEEMSVLYPWMNSKTLSKAWGRTCYYAWHDGYDR